MIDLQGTWTLISSVSFRNDCATRTFGDPPTGQLQYMANGTMSAFLMNPDWVRKGRQEADGFNEFFAYAGRWERDGDQITHRIDFASIPTKIGTRFVRQIIPHTPHEMELVTATEISKSGQVYVTRLRWKRLEPEVVTRPCGHAICVDTR